MLNTRVIAVLCDVCGIDVTIFLKIGEEILENKRLAVFTNKKIKYYNSFIRYIIDST